MLSIGIIPPDGDGESVDSRRRFCFTELSVLVNPCYLDEARGATLDYSEPPFSAENVARINDLLNARGVR